MLDKFARLPFPYLLQNLSGESQNIRPIRYCPRSNFFQFPSNFDLIPFSRPNAAFGLKKKNEIKYYQFILKSKYNKEK